MTWERAAHAYEAPASTRGLVMVLIGAADRRMLPALKLAPQLTLSEARAVHIALDASETHHLATAWMELQLDWLPLHIEEPTGGTLVESIRHVVEREAAKRPSVTVLVPEFDLGRWWQPLLHRGMGRRVAWHLHDIERATTAVLPVRIELHARAE